ncbi:MAG: DUF6034 family protein [Christensenellales bacterium]
MKKKCTKMLAMLLIFLTLFAATGCQPTPDEPPVVGKNNTNALVEATEAPYEAPEHWTEPEPITLNDLTVTIDADIVMPNVTKIPVYSVKDKRFTQEEADKIIAVLSEGKQLYSGNITRAEVEQSLIEQKKELKRVKEADVSEFGTEEAREIQIFSYEQGIKNAEEQLKEMPEKDVPEPVITAFQYSDEGGDFIRIRVDSGKTEHALIYINNGGKYISSTQVALFNGKGYTAYNRQKHEALSEDAMPNNLKTTKEEAKKQAQAMLDELGINYMSLSLIRPSYQIYAYTDKVNVDRQGWQLFYTRQVEGIPAMLFRDFQASYFGEAYFSDKGYNSSFDYEQCSFSIDDTGITEMRWSGAMELQEKLNDNARLLAFSEIQQQIKEQLLNKFVKPIIGKSVANQVHVTSIKLEYMRVRIKDTQDGFMLIPVWSVYGYNNATDVMGGKPKINPQYFTETLLTINATDGSVVDAYKGY